MRLLLDTNILIHREGSVVVRDDIGTLFRWIDQLKHEKCVHPESISEISKHADQRLVKSLNAKLRSYSLLRTKAPDTAPIAGLRATDRTENDRIDTSILAELAAGRVDALITEDRGIHRKAAAVGIAQSVFTIDAFLEKVTAENPELADYKVLSVRRQHFGTMNANSPFFTSFREDYPDFLDWFAKKSDECAYICDTETGEIIAFLYLKPETLQENYSNISPQFGSARRLKIGSFKVEANGYKLGERFLKIAFDNALRYSCDEIYVTLFRNRPTQERLFRLLEDWGFVRHGTKTSAAGVEDVLVRDFRPNIDRVDPRRTYPYFASSARKFIVPVYPQYHTELLPDSILKTESPLDFIENRPNRNAISKVYVSRSIERGLMTGDVIVFYRTRSATGPAHYTSVATTIGIVQEIITRIPTLQDFLKVCRKRSVFTDAELARHWNYSPSNRPFVVNFLYAQSFSRRPNLKQMKELGIIPGAPRGFEPLEEGAFRRLLEISGADKRLIVN